MPDALTVSMLFLALFVWIEGGRAQWLLICQSDARANPELHETCVFQSDLRNGSLGAHLTRWTFILLWPLWIAIGWANTLIQRFR